MYLKLENEQGVDDIILPINPEIEKLGYDDIRIRNYTEVKLEMQENIEKNINILINRFCILYEIEKIIKDKNINNDIAIKKIRELFNSIEFEGIKKVEKLKEK